MKEEFIDSLIVITSGVQWGGIALERRSQKRFSY